MIDTDKYEGHTRGPWDIIMPKMPYDKIEIVRDDVSYDQWTRPEFDWITIATLLPSQKHDAQLIADAPLLLQEVKRLREELRITQSNFSMVRSALANQYPEIEEAIWKVIE